MAIKPRAIALTPSAAPRAAGSAALSIRGLAKAFAGRPVLRGVDLDVSRGELVVVLGANGSGKSTALRCVVGLERPDAGTIAIDGHPAGTRRGQAAMVFQQIHLVRRRSALNNVCAGGLARVRGARSLSPLLFADELREEAMGCLARVGLGALALQRASTLSGGQQQRVAIARALCQRAPVILADEPVAALDPNAAEVVMRLLAELAHSEQLAVCVVLHQPDLARRYADRLVGILRGRLVFDTAPDDVSAAVIDELYAPEREPPAEE